VPTVATLVDDPMSFLQLTVGTTTQTAMRDVDIGVIWPFSQLGRTTSGLEMVSTSSYLPSSTTIGDVVDDADDKLDEATEDALDDAEDVLDEADDALHAADDTLDSLVLATDGASEVTDRAAPQFSQAIPSADADLAIRARSPDVSTDLPRELPGTISDRRILSPEAHTVGAGMFWPFNVLNRTTTGMETASTSTFPISSTFSDKADNALDEVNDVAEDADDALDDVDAASDGADDALDEADNALDEADDALDSLGFSADEPGGPVVLLQKFADAAGPPATETRKVRRSVHDDLSFAAAEAAEMTERAAASLQKFAELLAPRITTTKRMPHPKSATSDAAAGDSGTSAGHSAHNTVAEAFGDTSSKEAGPRETTDITTTTAARTGKPDERGSRQQSGSTASSTTTPPGRRDERGQVVESSSTITTTIGTLDRRVGALANGTTTSGGGRRGSTTEEADGAVAAHGGEAGSRARDVIERACYNANSVARSVEVAAASLQELDSTMCSDYVIPSTTPRHRGTGHTQHACKSLKDILRSTAKTSKSFHSFAQTLHPERTTTTTMPMDSFCAAISGAAEKAAILSDSLQECIDAVCGDTGKEVVTTTTTVKMDKKRAAVAKHDSD